MHGIANGLKKQGSMQDDLDAFLGDGRIVDEAAGSKALDVVEGEFHREADKLGLPSNADEGISGSCLASLHFFWHTAACWNPINCICTWVGATQELINKICGCIIRHDLSSFQSRGLIARRYWVGTRG